VPCRFLRHLASGGAPNDILLTYAVIPVTPSISCHVESPDLSIAVGFEHLASTLPTRFPAALGIGHGGLRLS